MEWKEFAGTKSCICSAACLTNGNFHKTIRACALAKWGKQTDARAVLEEILKLSNERYVPPISFALIYNRLGETDKALDYLEKGFAEKDKGMIFLKVEPKWNNLQNEPRFVDLMRRMNFE